MASYSNTLRFTGLSGIDTESMIQQLMKAEGMKVDRLKKQSQKYSWQQEAYRSIGTELQKFQKTFLDLGSASSLRLPSNWQKNTVSVKLNGQDSGAATVLAGSSAQVGNYTLKIDQLAQQETFFSQTQFKDTVNNTQYSGTTTLDKLFTNPTDAQAIKSFMDSYTGSANNLADYNVNELNTAIRAAIPNAHANFDGFSGRFRLQADNASTTPLNLSGIGSITSALGFGGLPPAPGTNSDYYIQGQQSVYWLNGFKNESDSNMFTYNGVDIKLNQVTNGQTVQIGVQRDTAKQVENIKKFVEAYNGVVDALAAQVKSPRPKSGNYSYYEPLTEEEKKGMKENDIKLWEDKAKAGLLYNDDILSGIMGQFREWLYQPVQVNGMNMNITQLGITTSDKMSDNGKLVIDEEKLAKALRDNPDGVAEFFTQSSTVPGKSGQLVPSKMKSQGMAERFNDIINAAVGTSGSIVQKAGMKDMLEKDNDLYKKIKEQNDRIYDMMRALTEKENYYYSMFAKMEQAVSASNSQMNYISGALGGR